MKTLLSTSLLAAGGFWLAAVADTFGQGFVGIEPDYDDPAFAFYTTITEEMTAAHAEWDPVSQPLPKSTQELSKIALESFVPAASQAKEGWKVMAITFRQVPRPPGGHGGNLNEHRNRWYCQVNLTAFGDYQGEWWKNSASVYLFLDGTIIKPERKKAPENSQMPKAE